MGTQGVYTFRILGQLCHLMGSLLPPLGESSKFAQIYLHSNDSNQVGHRMSLFPDDHLDILIVTDLQAMMRRCNPYYAIWKTAQARLSETDDVVTIRIKTIDAPTSHDHRRYNRPTAEEIAVIMPGTGENDSSETRDIIIEQIGTNRLQRISELHPSYLALRYPLLFPYGERGWHMHLFSVARYHLPITHPRLTLIDFFLATPAATHDAGSLRCNSTPSIFNIVATISTRCYDPVICCMNSSSMPMRRLNKVVYTS